MSQGGPAGSTSGGGGGGTITTINGNTGNTGASATPTIARGANWGNFKFTGDNVSTLTFETGDSATRNTFAGSFGGNLTLTGTDNTAYGWNNLPALTTGTSNTSYGAGCLPQVSTGSNNTSVGFQALNALLTGSSNTVLGQNAGVSYTGAESSNILIKNSGTVGESNTIRIGTAGAGAGQQNRNFQAGIRGITTGVADAVAVLIDSAGQLGTVSSSIRYKESIVDLTGSDKIFSLRPVSFFYKGRPHSSQIGLIAEEVEKVFPSLVIYDGNKNPDTVRYQDLPILLLSEMQKMKDEILSLTKQVKTLMDGICR